MQNLINFIWKNNFTFLFLLLEVISFTLLVQSNKFHKASFFTSANELSGSMYSMMNNITDYFALKRVNEELAEENARLRSLNETAFIKLYGNEVHINDSLYRQQYRFLGAKVVNASVNKRNNYITLNKGFSDGVKAEMGVIGPNGVVGIVKDASENYSVVISVLNSNTNLSGRLKKTDYFGILRWQENDSPDQITLFDIPNHVPIAKGDTVLSFGSSTIYPEGILIGTIASYDKIDGTEFYDIKVKLSTRFRSLSYVYIVRNLLKYEQLQLEKEAAGD